MQSNIFMLKGFRETRFETEAVYSGLDPVCAVWVARYKYNSFQSAIRVRLAAQYQYFNA